MMWRSVAAVCFSGFDSPHGKCQDTGVLPTGKPFHNLLGIFMSCRLVTRSAFVLIATLVLSATANAGLFRAYLSVHGNDSNPCTVALPCRLLPAALGAVNDGGEIWIVDSANFNTAPVNITQSVTILAIPGALGSVVGNGGDAIDINTTGVDVSLRNLKILNLSGGVNGINMTSGNSLTVEGCVIAGFTAAEASGIHVLGATATIVDTLARNNTNGIWFDNGANGFVTRSTVVGNSNVGILAYPSTNPGVYATVSDSSASGNGFGFASTGSLQIASEMIVTRSTASNNRVAGFQNNFGLMVVSGSTASHNAIGFNNLFGAFESIGDNTVSRNSVNDTSGPITLIAPK
jgi:Periplasmic copper-binding protein (NosD)